MEKGLETLQTADRTAWRRENIGHDFDPGETPDHRFPPARRERFELLEDEEDRSNDSAIGIEDHTRLDNNAFTSRDKYQQTLYSVDTLNP